MSKHEKVSALVKELNLAGLEFLYVRGDLLVVVKTEAEHDAVKNYDDGLAVDIATPAEVRYIEEQI